MKTSGHCMTIRRGTMDIDTKNNPHTEYHNGCVSVSYFKDDVACGVNDNWTCAIVQCFLSSFTVDSKTELRNILNLVYEVYGMGRSHLKRDLQTLLGVRGGY